LAYTGVLFYHSRFIHSHCGLFIFDRISFASDKIEEPDTNTGDKASFFPKFLNVLMDFLRFVSETAFRTRCRRIQYAIGAFCRFTDTNAVLSAQIRSFSDIRAGQFDSLPKNPPIKEVVEETD
jgi:hypothetical protein